MAAHNKQTIFGSIIDPNFEAKSKDGEEDDDGDDDDDYMEMEDVKAAVGGAFPSKSRTVPERKVSFRDEISKSTIHVSGAFLFTESWWEIEAEINKKTKKVCHVPRYRVKNLWGRQSVTEYLDQCEIDIESRSALIPLMNEFYKGKEFTVQQVLDLENLEEKYKGFPLPDNQKAALEMLRRHLPTSGCTALIRRAVDYPNLFWSLQSILPKKAFSILCSNIELPSQQSNRADDFFPLRRPPEFDGLNTAIEETPWEFGFSQVLFQKYNLCSCEAKLPDLKKSGIFGGLDQVMKDNLIVYDKLRSHCVRRGHTFSYCPPKTETLLFHKCADREKTEEFLCRDDIGAARLEPRCTTPKNIPALFLRRYWTAEKSIARQLVNIIKERNGHAAFEIPPLDTSEWEALDISQRRAVDYIRNQPLTILSGMGGCGKTTVVSKIVTHYRHYIGALGPEDCQEVMEGTCSESPVNTDSKQSASVSSCPSILLTAPTGRAASLLGKKCGLGAFTIHSVIYSLMKWKQTESPWVYAETKMLVVDECSMVAVTTIERLLDILLTHSSLSKVVLVGDIRQLPSVEPGNFFEDIFTVARMKGLGVDLETNHRVDAGGKIIVDNASRISRKTMPRFDEVTPGLPRNKLSRFHFLRVDDRAKGTQDLTLDRLGELLKENWDGIKDETTSQIITFTRKLVADANKDCCLHYNSHYPYHKSKKDFRIGDKICCRKNCIVQNPEYQPPSREGAEEVKAKEERDVLSREAGKQFYKISNGDTFIIKEMKSVSELGSTSEKALLDDMDGNQFWVNFTSFRRIGKVEHAWCRTIHTFQGSEMRVVVYLLSGNGLESWKHVYTAVTRGQQEVVIIGSESHLKRALSTEYKRYTGLSGFFQRALEEPDGNDYDAASPGMDGTEAGGLEEMRDESKSDQVAGLPVSSIGVHESVAGDLEMLGESRGDQDHGAVLPVFSVDVDVLKAGGSGVGKPNLFEVDKYVLISSDEEQVAVTREGPGALNGISKLLDLEEHHAGTRLPFKCNKLSTVETLLHSTMETCTSKLQFKTRKPAGASSTDESSVSPPGMLNKTPKKQSAQEACNLMGPCTPRTKSQFKLKNSPNTPAGSRLPVNSTLPVEPSNNQPETPKKTIAHTACTPRTNSQFKLRKCDTSTTRCRDSVSSSSPSKPPNASVATPKMQFAGEAVNRMAGCTPTTNSQFKLRKSRNKPTSVESPPTAVESPPADNPMEESPKTPKKTTTQDAGSHLRARTPTTNSQFKLRKHGNIQTAGFSPPDESNSDSPETPQKQGTQGALSHMATCTKTNSQFKLRKTANTLPTRWRGTVESPSPDKPNSDSPDMAVIRVATPQLPMGECSRATSSDGQVSGELKKRSITSSHDELVFPPSQNSSLSPEFLNLSLSQSGSGKSSRKRLKFQTLPDA